MTDASESIGPDVKPFDVSPVKEGFDLTFREGASSGEIANSVGIPSLSRVCVVDVAWPRLRS